MLILPRDVTGVMLCGGDARRMGGVEKPLLLWHDRPLLAHALDRLLPQVGHVIVSANRELDTYRAFGHRVVSDDVPKLGPLGGLASAERHVTTPWVFLCPGDAPRLDTALVSRLAAATTGSTTAVFPHDGERGQYLFLLVRTAAIVSLASYLVDGARSVHGWLATIGAKAVDMREIASTFTNVNTADALAKLTTDR